MVKFIVLCTKIIITAIVVLLFSSCKYAVDLGTGLNGTGNVQKETRTITEKFTKIEVSRGIEVQLEQANDVLVTVEADQNLINHITTKVVNGTLIISSDENINTAKMETVHVKMPTIESLESTSGSNIKSINNIKGNAIAVKSSSGSEIEVTLEYDSISCEATSGSTLSLSGKALKLETKSSSGSSISAENLLANDVISESTSGSSTDVHPLVNINGKASSGSSVEYEGNPKTVTKDESSGGSVSSK